MPAPTQNPQRLRVAHLNPRSATPFALTPDQATREAIAAELDLKELPKLTFQGEIRAEGGDAWALDGRLRAKVVQPCVITLKPVSTTIDDPVERIFSPHLRPPEEEEIEMPDEKLEPLGQFIDLSAVMIEALALALPEYPRAKDAMLGDTAIEDATPDTRRPFAGLDKLLGNDDPQE
ncbi:DUF177 domain-containing protein [Paracoccus sp. Z330]|uniref:DUF177 domain-containing protein n=1 Tax=Paracoccus onchidii TaxID=3017813 RepID=A0ABT4ZCQ9_9RHOB|nr:DUF177 domain-containing protein [Paracoccus onchidii]MDB6176506.1 DUF177 domain-containing protein [Paracoccus onchidii]